MTNTTTREEWLEAATAALAPIFTAAGETLPDVAVSCGFPGGASMRKVIGQCWKTKAANDGRAHLFVSPLLSDPVRVLDVLAHELVHAVDDCESGHKGRFTRIARRLGLEGKLTATHAGEALKAQLVEIAAQLGAYPNAGLNLALMNPAKQSTRMLKVECPDCGYVVRTTQKWLDCGLPTCACGSDMVLPG
jgi:hypothetical protein